MGRNDYSKVDEKELLKIFLEKKEDDVFGEIYGRYNKRIYNYMRKYLYYSQDSVVEDLVNEVFIKVYLKLAGLRDLAKFKSWIYQIAHNMCINHINSQKARGDVDAMDTEFSDKRENIEEKYISDELKRKIFNEIAGYDEKTRQIITLKFYQDLTYQEISGITGESVRSLKYIMKKVLEDLNIKLRAEGLY